MTIDELKNRPKFYYNIDGVAELGMGFMMLGWGLIGWLQVRTPADTIWHRMSLIYLGAVLAIIHYGTKAIKEHITYPRTGYVEYRKRDTRWRPGIAAAVIGALIPIALVGARRSHWDLTKFVSLFGLLLTAAYARGVAGWAVRWKWAVVWLMAAGALAIPALPANLVTDAAIHSRSFAINKMVGTLYLLALFYGVLMLVSGGISLWLYIRHTEAPAGETA